ncbi:MAG: signal peptidase II [Spirochaetia bacterium]
MSGIVVSEDRVLIKNRLMPLVLIPCIIAADQLSKVLVVRFIEPYTVGASFLDGIVRIIHTRNTAIAFSIGRNLPDNARLALFTLLPIVFILFLLIYYVKSDEFSLLQRWAFAGIIGGGVGNIIDRILRPEGVVDFIDVKIFGLFGMERWPTFNIADSSVVVGGIVLMVSLLVEQRGKEEK